MSKAEKRASMDQRIRDEVKEEYETEKLKWKEEKSKLEQKLQEKQTENDKINNLMIN